MFSLGDVYGPGFTALRVEDKAVPDPEDQQTMGGVKENVYLTAAKPANVWGAIAGIVLVLFLFGVID